MSATCPSKEPALSVIGHGNCSAISLQTTQTPRTPTLADHCANSLTNPFRMPFCTSNTRREKTPGRLRTVQIAHLRDYFSQDGATPSLRMLNLRNEFPTQWNRFLNPSNPAKGNMFELEMSPELFPFRDEKKRVKINSVWLLARAKDGENYTAVFQSSLASSARRLRHVQTCPSQSIRSALFRATGRFGCECDG